MRWGIGIHHEGGRRRACRGRGRDRGYVGGDRDDDSSVLSIYLYRFGRPGCPGHASWWAQKQVCNVNAVAWHFSFLEIQSSVTEN